MTIRKRLALWYSGLFTGLIIAFSVALVMVSRFAILQTVDDLLADVAQQVTVYTSMHSFDLESAYADSDNVFHMPGVSLQIWHSNSDDISDQPALWQASDDMLAYSQPILPDQMTVYEPTYTTITVNTIQVRVLSQPLYDTDGTQLGVIQVSTPLHSLSQMRQQMLTLTLIIAVVAVVLSVGLGMWVSRHLLLPIAHVTRAASSIATANDLSTRLDWDGPMDELGELASVFNHMMNRLEHLFSVQQRFIGDVSHELRTPLTSILGNLELMEHYGFEQASLDAVHREAERMSRMVNDLLLLTRADYGGLEIDLQPIDLDVIVLEVYQQALVLYKKRKLPIVLERIEPAQVNGNAERLCQLVMNLLDNAVKFTGEGGAITLAIYSDAADAIIDIRDTGIGIDEIDLQRIFDRFYQVDKSRVHHSEEDGAGLGLAIVRWIVTVHGGSTEVRSKLGEGTHFRVRIPLFSISAVTAHQHNGNMQHSRQSMPAPGIQNPIKN